MFPSMTKGCVLEVWSESGQRELRQKEATIFPKTLIQKKRADGFWNKALETEIGE